MSKTVVSKRVSCLWPVLVLIAATAPMAAAATIDERRINVGGFGTVGALYHDEEGLEYRRTVSQGSGAAAGEVDFATDTIGGLQLNAAWSRNLEAVVQGVTRLTSENDWDPQLTRAFVRYNPTETLSLRAGRLGWDVYPRNDSRDIGYSQLAIRPTLEVFGNLPTDSFDGGELALKRLAGEGVVSLRLYGGRSTGEIVTESHTSSFSGSKIWGGHVDYEHGAWGLRLGAGVFEQKNRPALDPLAAALRMTGVPQAVALGDDFAGRGRKTLFVASGVAYDEGPLQARLFVSYADSESTGAQISVGQLTGGYRVGQLTPYTSLSFIDDNVSVRETGLPDTPELAPLNAGARMAQEASKFDHYSLALGLRWDFLPKLALKLQVDEMWLRDSVIVLDRRPDPSQHTEMTVLGAALDFVF